MKKEVDTYLDEVSYAPDPSYIPSEFALDFINFIKLVNQDKGGEENKTPVMHLKMLDTLIQPGDTVNLCYRGSAKSTLFGEYGILYIAVYGKLPGFGDITYMLYVTDSIENGVKSMRDSLESRYANSSFLQEYLPKIRITETYWEFTNKQGHVLAVNGYGAGTGIRGTKKKGVRPQMAILDDLLSDKDATSPTVIQDIENTVYKAVFHALHPTRRKIVWCGTPFNKKDPLYKAVESGAWNVNVFPVCEKFPCAREDFRGAWEDRFPYDHVSRLYQIAKDTGTIQAFNQELMLRIISDDDRLITLNEIQWYSLKDLLKNKNAFNFYITTDFAVSDKQSADYSVISVWAYSNNGDFYYVDGIVKRQTIDKTLEDLFAFNSVYRPMLIGIEVTGQQGGFIDIIKKEALRRNSFINLAKEPNSSKEGIRPVTNKLSRFQSVLPWFKMHKMYFPEELKEDPRMTEFTDELLLATPSGFKSKHDDCIDTISMLSCISLWKPAATVTPVVKDRIFSTDFYEEEPEASSLNSYLA